MFADIQLLPTDRPQWSNEDGQEAIDHLELVPPPGWIWQDQAWVVDFTRAVDKDGWEYAFDFSRAYFPAKKKVRLAVEHTM
jgi:hypothetical protein